MGTLHVFNPDHDIALAANLSNFTAPKAGRELCHDLGWLPVLWAEDGDYVMVDEIDAAVRSVSSLPFPLPEVNWLQKGGVFIQKVLADIHHVEPWGWNKALTQQLRRTGLKHVPDDQQLERLRMMSHRDFAASHFLSRLVSLDGRLVGEAALVTSLPYINNVVLKAPWSSSGRGVRFVIDEDSYRHHLLWAQNVIRQQGGVMVEPLYNRVLDFGMEFYADGVTTYLGLSLFATANGAYMGNVLMNEEEKREVLSHEISLTLLDLVRTTILSVADECIAPFYTGPFGIDMMVVKTTDGAMKLHPCVEMNLRRTMGHVALDVFRHDGRHAYSQMSVRYDGTYSFLLT